MTSSGYVLAFFGDTEAASAAFSALRRNGYRRIAALHKKSDGKIAVMRPPSRTPAAAVAGAAVGAVAGRFIPGGQAFARALPVAGGIVGAAIGAGLGQWSECGIPEKILDRFRTSLMLGETLIVVHAASQHLPDAMSVLRAGEIPPVTFVDRPSTIMMTEGKAPLRGDVLPPDRLRELALEIAGKQQTTTDSTDGYLLDRLEENRRIVSSVVRGLSEASRLEQPVSLSAEWLLDNNYIIQGQIKDVQRNLDPKFYRELPVLKSGRYSGVPRVYLLASEFVAATDSRISRDQLLDFVHAYQTVLPLTTGELWALPLMLRLALVENLRRLTSELDRRQREREQADFWANRLLVAAFREPDQILPLLAQLSKEQRQIAPHFADRLVSHLFDEEAALGPARAWLERKLETPLADITGSEQRRQAADGVSVANVITSLRFLSNLDWRDCFEELSLVDQILAQDPAGVYRSMDFDTRDRYRRQVERIARGSDNREVDVAAKVVSAAAEASKELVQQAPPSHGEREHETLIYQPSGHVGYYLIDDGLDFFEIGLGYRKSTWRRVRRWVRDNPEIWYFGAISLGTIGALGTLAKFARLLGGRLPLPTAALALLPASEVAVQVVNYAATRILPPRPLPKMEFREGVPERWKTAVVIPMLLTSETEGEEVAHQLELHYLSCPDPQLRFAMLADFIDGHSRHMPEDAARLEAAQRAIEALNRKHGGDRFFLFIRDRIWSNTEERWMGWERKRGKLEQFNAYLKGRRSQSPDVLHPVVGNPEALDGIRFVITLDADTQLPYGSARKLIETLAHPLNRPVLTVDPLPHGENRAHSTLVRRGYTIIQPRVDTALPSATATRFSRLFTDASGTDPYTHVISDVYQDAFGEASYHGKGIYDLDAFDRVLAGRFPDATLLSHDLLEGAHVRVGLASDIQLLDSFPPHYLASAKRDHRWIRGDWQIMDWMWPWIPTPRGHGPNPLSLLNRWKIKDNLRRSLLAPASVGMLLGGWFMGPVPAVAASVGVAGLLLWPTAINLFTRLTTKPDSLLRSRHEVTRTLVRAAFDTSLLLQRAGLSIDAIVRVLYRRFVSGKLLLEWQTAASTYGGAGVQQTSFLLRLAMGSALAGVLALLLISRGPAVIWAATPYLLAWGAAPFTVMWLASGSKARRQEALELQDEEFLRRVARQTWRYFDDFVGPQTNWLPPDNYQEALTVEIAQRTSPTNMGLWLLACVAAHDFGWLTLDEVVSRTSQTLQTFDEMEKFNGHLLNWYNSLTLDPLRPRYVSTVDSGNLLASLWALVRGIHELSQAPLFSASALHGLNDVLDLLEEALGKDGHFQGQIADVRRLTQNRSGLAIDLISAVRALEFPVSRLSSALAMRALPRRASARARAELHSAATDPRFAISSASYWAAQLQAQMDLWIQQANRYGRWIELLAEKPDQFLFSLGEGAVELRARVLADSTSLASLGRGEVSVLLELLNRRHQPDVVPEVVDWLNQVAAEFDRSRWLAGEMLAQCETVVDGAQRLADGMDLRFLYDPERKLFSIGYSVEERRLDASYYDLLASECRLASFCAVARGDVPPEHWLALGRRFGETPVGPALMSWSGTMFEYLMPVLFQRAYENSLLDYAVRTAVSAQIAYGNRRGVPWGMSEAAFSAIDANRIYQYKAFGVPTLGLKRGLDEDLVVAPYASLMALLVDREAAVTNLRRLEGMGLRGDYGFYESVDFTRERLEEDSLIRSQEGETETMGGRRVSEGKRGAIVRCFMVHHQGMALMALQNVLCDSALRRRFHSDSVVQAAEPLLYERIPEAPPLLEDVVTENVRPVRTEPAMAPLERFATPDTPAPRAHLLGGEHYSVMLTAAGGGYSRWGDYEISRWRSDTARDNWGQFLYVRDMETGTAWSAAHQPLRRSARWANVSFKAEKVEYERRDAEIETRMEVCVSPEDDAEIRRITLINHSGRTRKIETTSFLELALAPHVADRAHPAFNKLFIQTAVVPDRDALLAWRRARSAREQPVWAAHLICSTQDADEIQFETDRGMFLGRGRSAESPAGMEGDLSGSVGAVLDPCFSLRRRITLYPGQRVQIAYVTCAANSEEKIQQLVEKFGDFAACERAFDLAWTHSQLELHHLRVQADEAQAFQQLAGYMLYPHQSLRAPLRRLRENRKGQSGLWAYGISGDLPILLVAVDNARDLPAVRQAIMAHTFWRVRGFKADLVIMNEQAGGYAQDLTETLRRLVESSTPYTGVDKPGGVFLRTSDTMPPEDQTLLMSVARVLLVAARGGVAQQLGTVADEPEPAPRFTATQKETSDPEIPLPFMELPYFNGLGGFTQDGREYAIYLAPRDRTPAPWINVFAHEEFGALTSESGQGFAWYGNSQSNRILPWSNDPVSDTPVEAMYIRDEETGAVWCPTALPIRDNLAYRARHGQGYTVFEHNRHGIEHELITFVPLVQGDWSGNGTQKFPPVRLQRLCMVNRSNRPRKLLVTFYAELLLGTTREEHQQHVVSSWDTETGTLLARNDYHPDFSGRIAFASASPKPQYHSADRIAFLGRNGSPASPAAMRRRHVLERTGAGLDPCAVLQVPVELEPGEEKCVTFLLGQAGTVEECRTIVRRFRDRSSTDRALETTRHWWDSLLETVQVDVPDMAVNFLLNRWLPYQTLSCRVWARSALYQSGGAWGFRDQLQDSLALTTLYPAAARQQILRSAAHQFEEGDVQHWWHPPSDAGVRTRITDDLLFLPYAVAQYVKVTGDLTILDEEVHFLHADVLTEEEHEKYFQPQISETRATIFEHCRRAIEKGSTFGPHGLPLIGGGDWNDGLNRVGIEGKGESVWLAWFIVDVLNSFAEVCKTRGEAELVKTYRARAKQYLRNIDKGAWDGEWYRRGYYDDGTPLGSATSEEAKIDSLPQSWSVIAGGGNKERSHQAMESAEQYLVKADEKMVFLFTPAFDKTTRDPGYIKGYLPGVRENGGQYTHAACWFALALARSGRGDKAVEVLRMLNPVEHARTREDTWQYKVEPYVVAADVYALEGQVGRGGWTWYTGSCGWMYRVWMEEVLGFQKHGDRLLINPTIPSEWPGFKITYRHGGTVFEISVENPDRVMTGVAVVEVDGKALRGLEIPLVDDGQAHHVTVRMGERIVRRALPTAEAHPGETNGHAELHEVERES